MAFWQCAHQGVYSTSNLIYHEVYFPPSYIFFQYKQKRKRPKEIVLKHGFRQWLFIYTVLLAKGEIVSVLLISWHWLKLDIRVYTFGYFHPDPSNWIDQKKRGAFNALQQIDWKLQTLTGQKPRVFFLFNPSSFNLEGLIEFHISVQGATPFIEKGSEWGGARARPFLFLVQTFCHIVIMFWLSIRSWLASMAIKTELA